MRIPSAALAVIVYLSPLSAYAAFGSYQAGGTTTNGTSSSVTGNGGNGQASGSNGTYNSENGTGFGSSPTSNNSNTAANTAPTNGSDSATTPTPVTDPQNTQTAQTEPVSAPAPGSTGQQQAAQQLAQAKEQAWKLINSGDQQAAQQYIREALQQNPDDKDLQAMAVLGERHQIVMDNSALARKMAALGGLKSTGALGGTAAQPERPQKPILASALGMLGAPAPLAAVQAPPALKGALSQTTFLKMRMQDFSGAERDLTETILAEPGNWLAYRLRAFTRRFEKNIPGAESDADRALQLNPKDAPSHDVKALLALDQHQAQAAIGESALALALNPKDSDAYATRAQAEALLGQRDAALADYKTAADLDPQFGAMYRQALYAAGGRGPGLSRVYALYAAAAGLALLFFGLSLVSRKGQTKAATTRRPAMRAEDNAPAGVPGFRVLRRIGQGGMGVVYEAYDETLQRKVALKRMRDEIAGDPRERKRFMREARLVAGLRHPGIVEIFSLVEQDSALYLVFEYLPGETLDAMLERRGGRLQPPEALRVLRDVAEALDYAHAQGVVHQDLKPSNVLVSAVGAKVMDFGIARRVQDTLSTMSRAEAVGTPAYMAPEQEQGVITPKADLFALGVCAYELLAGRAPFGRSGGLPKLEGQFVPLSRATGLPEGVDAAVAAALNPDPEKRPSNAAAFVSALETAFAATKASA